MNQKSLIKLALVIVPLLAITSCVQNPFVEGNNYFAYKIDVKKKLSIDYGFVNNDYVILFELYDQYPLETIKEADGGERTVKKEIEPIYKGATDGSGKFKGEVMVLASMSSVWLYTEYAGGLSPVELKIQGSSIDFNLNKFLSDARPKSKATRATTPSNKTYPDGWMLLGDWDRRGTPDYLEAERKLPQASLLYDINEIYVKYNRKKLSERFPNFFEEQYKSEINILKPTKVYLTFINSTAAWANTVGYFVYPTGQEPQSRDEIQQIVAFPSCYPFVKDLNGKVIDGALVGGDRVLLKYWDGKEYKDEFPEGVTIGWWMEGMGFNVANANLNILDKGRYSRFSLDQLNTDKLRRTVALQDPNNGRVVAIGFEDNLDMLFNDATFYLEVEEEGAIQPNLPDVPDVSDVPSDKENILTKEGYLLFEDLWPSKGDYDLNDIVIKYKSKVHKHILNNKVYKIVDEYTPLHSGGSLISGFGYQHTDLSFDQIYSVAIESDVPSVFMEGQSLEPNQDFPTVILFDNIKKAVGKKYVVTTEFNDAIESTVCPPYNPFIIVRPDSIRGREVHLVGYPPTMKADKKLFGTASDGSDLANGIFYVDRNRSLYPFSLNIPSKSLINSFSTWEGDPIDESFPKFKRWVETNGKEDADWYLSPAKK